MKRSMLKKSRAKLQWISRRIRDSFIVNLHMSVPMGCRVRLMEASASITLLGPKVVDLVVEF